MNANHHSNIMASHEGGSKSQNHPLFIRTPDGVQFRIFNSQREKIPFDPASCEMIAIFLG